MRLSVIEVYESAGAQRLRTPVRIKLNSTLEALDRDGSGGLMFLEEFSGGQYQSENLNVIASHERCRDRIPGVFVKR
jgi:hypothetical protein